MPRLKRTNERDRSSSFALTLTRRTGEYCPCQAYRLHAPPFFPRHRVAEVQTPRRPMRHSALHSLIELDPLAVCKLGDIINQILTRWGNSVVSLQVSSFFFPFGNNPIAEEEEKHQTSQNIFLIYILNRILHKIRAPDPVRIRLQGRLILPETDGWYESDGGSALSQ